MRRQASILALVASLSSVARGQAVSAVTVRGTVLDAASSLPIAGAQLTLTAIAPAVLPPASPSPTVTGSRVTVTDSAGAYELRGVAAGEYRLLVRRLGYRAALVDLDANTGNEARISFGLVVTPVRLQAVKVDADRLNLFGRLSLAYDTGEVTRPSAALARQAEYLSTDVRELTALGAIEGASLGEVDIFRALRRLPGVSGADDETTALWVRGGRWDQVRVSFDGMPLFNPFHTPRDFGGMTGISGDAIGAAFLHPGVRPVSLFSQGASLVDVRSRAPIDSNARVVADASLRSATASFEKASRTGRTGISLIGRRSFWPDIANFRHPGDPGPEYAELAGRVDHDFGGGKSIELSHLVTRDYDAVYQTVGTPIGFTLSRVDPDILRSGTRLMRATLNLSARGLRLSNTVGYSAYESRDYLTQYPIGVLDSVVVDGFAEGYTIQAGVAVPSFSRVSYATLRGTASPISGSAEQRWSLGYELSTYRAATNAPRHAYSWSDLSPESLHLSQTLALASLWAERRWRPADELTVDAGLRVESDRATVAPRLAPSLLVRRRIGGLTTASAGISRNYQDTQELPFTQSARYDGESRGFWLLSGDGVPAMRATQAHGGIDRWVSESVLVDLNVYARRLTNVAVQPLANGDSAPRPMFDAGVISARGLEASARKLSGRLTGSVAYSYGKATERVGGQSFAAPGDRRHTIDGSSMIRLGFLRLGAGVTYMTGAPYTRTFPGGGRLVAPDSIQWLALPRAEAPSAERLPSFFSLDLFAEATTRLKGVGVTMYGGLQNVTDHHNFTAYRGHTDGSSLPSFFGGQPNGDFLYWSGTPTGNIGLRIVF
jgi:hypothetical protein